MDGLYAIGEYVRLGMDSVPSSGGDSQQPMARQQSIRKLSEKKIPGLHEKGPMAIQPDWPGNRLKGKVVGKKATNKRRNTRRN